MPRKPGEPSAEALRAAARAHVAATSLRQAARDIGMSPTGLKGFITGTAPYAKTSLKLLAWFVVWQEERAADETLSPEAAASALTLLVMHLAPEHRPEAAAELVAAVAARCRQTGTLPPAWLRELS